MVDNTQTSDGNIRNRAAAGFMLGAVGLYSMLPLVLQSLDAKDAPFLFNSVMTLFVVPTYIIFLLIYYRDLLFNQAILKKIRINCHKRAILLASLGGLDYAFFAWSLSYIDTSITTIFFETWPFFIIFISAWLFKSENRYRKIKSDTLIPVVFGFIGFVFVIFSNEQFLDINKIDINGHTLFGVALAVTGAFLTAMPTPYIIKWAADLDKSVASQTNVKMDFFFLVVGLIIMNLIGGFISFVLGVGLGEEINGVQISGAIISGVFITGIAGIMFRYANIRTSNLGVNALSYATPVISLIWLGMASLINVPHIDFLIIGTVIIIAANLLLNFEASIRLAYKALIIALWACGTVVYLHGGFLLPDYASTVGISATLFILILSFRTDRLVRRATKEENTAFRIFRKISGLAEEGKIKNDDADNAAKALLKIDAHKTPDELRKAYNKLKGLISGCSKEHIETLDDLKTDIDILTHSKQQGVNFGELTALGFIGIILIFSLLFFHPPDMTGWGGFFIEMSAFTLAAVVLFLFFNIIDLQRDRSRPILEEVKEVKTAITADNFSIVFRDATNRGFEQWISVIVCIAITLAYGWMFWGKWLS